MSKKEWLEPMMERRMWAFPGLFTLVLIIAEYFDFLIFHSMAELFTIVIAFIMFALAWTTSNLSKNLFLLFLACGYLWIGALDLLHLFAYKGINLFIYDNGNTGVQFWIAARYSEATLLLLAPILAPRAFNKYALIIVFGLIATCFTTIILLGYFPVVFRDVSGLTNFKIYSEYIIVLILLMALFTIFRSKNIIDHDGKVFITYSVILSMCAELSFTFYVDVYGISNLAGHIFKVFSYWFIFRAIILTNLEAPYKALLNSQAELQKTLKELENQKYVLDHHALVVVTNPVGDIEYVNDKFVEISGYTYEDLIGQNPRLLKSGYHQKDYFTAMWDTISGGEIWHGEICNRAKDGTLYWLETTIAPLMDEKGNIEQYIAVRTDVSDRKRTEEQLRQTHKMKAVGQLTGGIAHDFNNILGIIMGNLEILQVMLRDNPKALKRVETAKKGAKRGADLTKNLLGFSRTTSFETELASVNDSINHMKELIEKSLTVSITVKNTLPKNLWPVQINKGDFEDALLNLALNARDVMVSGGSLQIETSNVVLDDNYVKLNSSAKAGEYVMIAVSDTGSGMTKKVMEKALEPFFTTKSDNNGTGLGLSMVHGFVQRSGGHMNIYSEVGRGTTFKLYIPRAHKNNKETMDNDPLAPETIVRGNETVLVVDDEKALIELAKANLRYLGYKVITAPNAPKALAVLKDRDDIDLLFSDIVMPGGVDGYQLSLSALEIKPSLKILLTSGFTKNREKYLHKEDDKLSVLAQNLLSKPYNQAELANALRKALDD